MSTRPIADYAMLSDSHSAALVSRDGSVDWLCFPRFDSPSVLARILDESAGHWSIRPAGWNDPDGDGQRQASRRYLDDTMVLETTFTTSSGTMTTTEGMAFRHTPGDEHDLGTDAPHALVRRVECTDGEVEVDVVYTPRPEYGLMVPRLQQADGSVFSRGGSSMLLLSASEALQVQDGGTATARFRLSAGESACFTLHCRSSHEGRPDLWDADVMEDWLDQTVDEWRQWSTAHKFYDGPWADLVQFSGRVLQSLTFWPTGAIVAAPTTSLPECPGGSRNWDYRYSWVRDASLTVEALYVTACPEDASSFFDWIDRTAAGDVAAGQHLQIVYGIGGEHEIGERELPHLSGWRDSAPVRVGNGAWYQLQLDVYGELLGAVHRSRDRLPDKELNRAFLIELADAAIQRWQDRDQGIWEIRGGPRHFTYSKLMCWMALDRAIDLADWLDATERVEDWKRHRGEIRAAIEERGWNDDIGAFVQAFDNEQLDASVLMLPITGFLDADDPRVRSTVDVIERELTDDRGLVYRYLGDDHLEGTEGTFLLCTFWLAQCHALAGEVELAREVFERAVSYTNDVGLLAEEVDPETGELLGNFPQAFSHIGLVNAAWQIHQTEQSEHMDDTEQVEVARTNDTAGNAGEDGGP